MTRQESKSPDKEEAFNAVALPANKTAERSLAEETET